MLLIRNEYLNVAIAQVEITGVVSRQPAEVECILRWLRESPIADQIVVRFGSMSPVTASSLQGAAAGAQIRSLEAKVESVSNASNVVPFAETNFGGLAD